MGWTFDRVFVIRHGQTNWNRTGRRQGQLDSPLTATGRRAAQTVAGRLAPLKPDQLFSSPLGRAQATADAISTATDLPVRLEPGLSEIHHGELAGLTNGEIESLHPGLLEARRRHLYDWRFPEGESYRDGDQRARQALRRIEADGAHRPVLVTHEMIGRMLLGALLGLGPEVALDISLVQGVVHEVLVSGARPVVSASSDVVWTRAGPAIGSSIS